MIRALTLILILIAGVNSAEPVKIRTIARGNFSGIQSPTELVVTNTAQWTELWKKHSARRTPSTPPPEIDFEKESVLFVTLGQKHSGGYSVEITALREANGKIEILVKTRAPKPGGLQLQAITAPFHIAAVPKLTGPAKFKLDEAPPPEPR